MTRRADRLFEIIQVLRRARGPLTADALAAELEISRRTVYRDIAVLMSQRVPIRGEAGTGYVLDKHFDLPPLAFTPDEIEAVVLGAQWVTIHADPGLSRAAARVLSKITSVIPEGLRHLVDDPVVRTPPARDPLDTEIVDLGKLRSWSHAGRKLVVSYTDGSGAESERTIWPFLIGYQDGTRVIMAWCELRHDFRLFRVERVRSITFLDEHYPESPSVLRRRWLAEVMDSSRSA